MQTSSAKDRAYTVIPYQESWRDNFEAIKNQLLPVFGDQAIDIMHVGSTAIVGMSGKPTIDVLVIVNNIPDIDALNEAMAKLGYLALGAYVAPDSRLFAKEENNERFVNIHCFERNHPHAQEMILMRDFLQSHPDEAKAYADLKIDLHRRYPNDYKEYRHFKDPYLTKMKARAIEWAESGIIKS